MDSVHGREMAFDDHRLLEPERSILSTPFLWAGRYRLPSRGTVGLYLQTLSCGFEIGLGIWIALTVDEKGIASTREAEILASFTEASRRPSTARFHSPTVHPNKKSKPPSGHS